MSRPRRAFGIAVAAGLVAMGGMAIPASTTAQEPWEVVASGLDNPRHLAFAPGGALYVAEAGSGGSAPCVEHPGLGLFCLGFTGAVTRVRLNGPDTRVVTGLPSIINLDGETLGPSDLVFNSRHKFVLSIGLGGSNQFRDGFGDDGDLLATLVAGNLNRNRNGVSVVADVMANELANNPDGTDIDSNPVGILRKGSDYVIADAGGNAVVRTSKKGNFTTIATLPPGSALAPPFLGLPPGTQIPTDAVPTSVVRGPDGAFYISQLTGFPFEKGDANIWRVVPGQAPTVYASGLTNLTDLAFDRDGSLYAVEIASNGLLGEPIGALKKVTPGSSTHETIAGGLFAPYGVALKKGSAYVSTCAVCVGEGEVIRIPLD
jgi:sugar lactone lactonase YvrE